MGGVKSAFFFTLRTHKTLVFEHGAANPVKIYTSVAKLSFM